MDEVEAMLKPVEPQATASVVSSASGSVSESDELGEGSPNPLEELLQLSGEEARLYELASEIGPVKEGSDGVEFRNQLLKDESLKDWRELGKRNERGFKWKKNMLVRCMYGTWEQFRDVLVLPRSYRARVLELGHERNGHLGVEKVNAMIARYFVWPGMARDIVDHCTSCVVCQRRSKHKPRRAPAVERPVLTEPFESVAIDLVGPLPKVRVGVDTY